MQLGASTSSFIRSSFRLLVAITESKSSSRRCVVRTLARCLVRRHPQVLIVEPSCVYRVRGQVKRRRAHGRSQGDLVNSDRIVAAV